MNRAAFYFSLRKQGLAGTLNQSQVNGMETVLDAIAGAEMTAQAYMLATIRRAWK